MKFGIVTVDQNLSYDENLIRFIAPLVSENLKNQIDHPLQMIILTEAYKSIQICKELDGTLFAQNLIDIYLT